MQMNEFPPDLRGMIKEVCVKPGKKKSPLKDFNTYDNTREILSSASTLSPPPNRHKELNSFQTKTTLSS
jgi:hypothetical protein